MRRASIAALSVVLAATARGADPPPGFPPAGDAYRWTSGVMLGLYGVLLFATVFILKRDRDWSLAGALTEDGKPSTNRLIAFMGMQAMLVLYLGIGSFQVWRLFRGETADLPGFFLMGL